MFMTVARVCQALPGRRLVDMNTTALHTDNPHHQQASRSGVVGHLLARWPTVVGLLALTANASGGVDSHVTAFIIIIASMCYVATAALGTQRSGWIMVAVASIAVVGAGLTGLDKTVTLLVMGVGFAAYGLLRPGATNRREVWTQALGFVAFSLVALAAMMSGPVLAGLLAATAALGHCVWDAVHFLRDRVVPRSLSEACFALDLGLGVALLAVTLANAAVS